MELYKIKDVAKKYELTSRTIRYYEEIGLIESIRDEDSNYRYFSKSELEKLEKIVILRKLDISIKEIKDIFISNDINILVDVFKKKKQELKSGILGMEMLEKIIDHFLRIIGTKNISYIDGFEILMANGLVENNNSKEFDMKGEYIKMENINKLGKSEVRIINVKPFKVAYYVAKSASPESDAWAKMKSFIKKNKLDQKSNTRYFGFNNPSPQEGSSIYGYEVWVVVDDSIQQSEEVKIKEVQNGLYSVCTSGSLSEIGERWEVLYKWMENSEYKSGEHQWLEEHIVLDIESLGKDMQMDLYLPIEKK